MLKILAHLHDYPPKGTGADIMAAALNTYLADNGFEVTVAIDNCPEDYTYKNHKVTTNKTLLGEKYEAADLIITHLVTQAECAQIAARFNKPIFHVVHNAQSTHLQPAPNNYLIYNTHHLHGTVNFPLESIVVQPPTFLEDWANDTDHFNAPYITMVNMVRNKNPECFYMLVQSLPRMKFLAVRGAYGEQFQKDAPNLAYKPFGSDMKEIYSQTKILVVPSFTESWSLCAAEAMSSGIPVVCADLPGLRENCGHAAIYCGGNREYIDAVLKLQDYGPYSDYVLMGQNRQREKNHLAQLNNLANFIRQKVEIMYPEKKEIAPVKEKVEIKPSPEKKEIKKPGRPKKIKE